MRCDSRSYSSINKHGPKVDGKFSVAFGEFPRISNFTLQYGDGAKYEFGSSGAMTRHRRNEMGDLRTEEAIARTASKLIKDSQFVTGALKKLQEKKYNISVKDMKAFGKIIETRHHIRDEDGLTSKLMGGS